MLDRRMILKLAGGLSMLGAAPAEAAAHHGKKRAGASLPNIIHICTDDMRSDDIDLQIMPQLSRIFASPSLKFDNHSVPFTLCAPSRVSILTGLEPHNHGVLTDHSPGGYAGYQPLEGNSLPVWLTNAGYYVGHVGKFINEYDVIAPNHVPPGYADWRAMSCSFEKYTNFTLNENGTQVSYDNGEYTTDVFVQKVLDFIAAAPQPFALFFWPNCCHWPAVPAAQDAGTFANVPMPISPSFNEADVSDKPRAVRKLPLLRRKQIAKIENKWRTRAECLQSLDRGMKTIMDALQTAGLLSNTHIMFTSDNGIVEGEHRIQKEKNVLYEEGVTVPLLWHQPSGYNQNCKQPVSNIDTTAAMVELSGATAQRVLDGESLTPLLADVDAPWKTAALIKSKRTTGICTSHFRYIEWSNGDRELYDMTIDPYQLDNKQGQSAYQDIQQSCATALATLEVCAGDSCTWTGRFPPPPT
jgi:N-acetylglucosamine-6-sulfatase